MPSVCFSLILFCRKGLKNHEMAFLAPNRKAKALAKLRGEGLLQPSKENLSQGIDLYIVQFTLC